MQLKVQICFDPIDSYRVLLHFVAGEKTSLQIKTPDVVLMNDDVHGQCISDIRLTFITITPESRRKGCNFAIEINRSTVGQGENRFYCIDFVIKNVIATCEYQCAFSKTVEKKTVVVLGMDVHTHIHICICRLIEHHIYIISVDAMILPTSLNITTYEGMPAKLNCTVMASNKPEYYKMIWMKGNVFLSGSDYSVESTTFDNNSTNTQTYYLTIHKASPGAYTCMLISTKKKVIDAKTQHVITESEYSLRLVASLN